MVSISKNNKQIKHRKTSHCESITEASQKVAMAEDCIERAGDKELDDDLHERPAAAAAGVAISFKRLLSLLATGGVTDGGG